MKSTEQDGDPTNASLAVHKGFQEKNKRLKKRPTAVKVEGGNDKETYQLDAKASFAFSSAAAENKNDDARPPDGQFQLIAGVNVLKPRAKFASFRKWFKLAAFLIPLLWIYEQYLESNYRGRIDQAEQDLRTVTDQLASSSPGITASGVRAVYDLAFKELPVEPSSNWYSPPVNLVRWLASKRERRLLERSRNLFREFAAAPRIPTEDDKDVVSTAILKTAIEWSSKENSLLQKSPQDPSLWFLYRAKISKAYAPSSRLEGVQFYDADLNRAILNSSNLSNAYMERSNLEQASLESCNLTNANLIKANLNKARLNFARLDSAKLQESNLSEADLTLAVLVSANFQGANLSKAILRTADLQQANFKESNLSEANLSQANIRGADFEGADLRRADFRFANGLAEVKSWRGALVKGARFPSNFSPNTKEKSP